MTTLKICGLKPGDDLSFTSAPIVSHVGIVFVPASKRYVPTEDAAAIVRGLDRNCLAMGVFANQDDRTVMETVHSTGVAGAQLHGNESPDLCSRLRAQGYVTWKATPVPIDLADAGAVADAIAFQLEPFTGTVDAVLLDAAPPKGVPLGMTGGHGVPFQWSVLPTVLRRLSDVTDVPIWVAGGITPTNVGQLLSVCRPFGVDVSSGVEEEGRKSPARIDDLIRAVEAHGAA